MCRMKFWGARYPLPESPPRGITQDVLSSPEMSSDDTCEVLPTSKTYYRLSAQDFFAGQGGGC